MRTRAVLETCFMAVPGRRVIGVAQLLTKRYHGMEMLIKTTEIPRDGKSKTMSSCCALCVIGTDECYSCVGSVHCRTLAPYEKQFAYP